MKTTAVTILIQDPSTGLFLGVSRRYDPNDFGLPGGKVDPGETPEQAALRELEEETGLVGDPSTLKRVFSRYCEGGADGIGYQVATFTVVPLSMTIAPAQGETGRVAWITTDTLFRGCFGDYNRALFTQLGLFEAPLQ